MCLLFWSRCSCQRFIKCCVVTVTVNITLRSFDKNLKNVYVFLQNKKVYPALCLTASQTTVWSMTNWVPIMATTTAIDFLPQVIGLGLIWKRRPFAGNWNTFSWAPVTNIMPRAASLISWSCSFWRSLLSQHR